MTKWQIRLLAIACWLGAICLAIPYAALHEHYAQLRDARQVTATVASVSPHGKHVEVVMHSDDADLKLFYPDGDYTFWPMPEDAPAVGSTVPLLVSRSSVIRAAQLPDKKPSPLLVVGAIFAVVLGGFVWWLSGRDAKRRAARREPLDVVIDAARRTRNVRTAAAIIFFVFAPLFAVLPSLDHTASRGMTIAIYVIAALTAVVAVTTAVMAYKLRDPRRNWVVELIAQRPSEIAWFYVHEYRGKYGARAQEVAICTTAGKRVQLRVVPEDVEPMLGELSRRAPRARRGYDREVERKYKADPTSVLGA